MKRFTWLAACLILILATSSGLAGAIPLNQLTSAVFPVGTIVVPMDSLQHDRLSVYGLIHTFLRQIKNPLVYRVIEPPNMKMQTALTPSGATYKGGPFLINQGYTDVVNKLLSDPAFASVTITTLTASFSSDKLFIINQPTTILYVKGVFGEVWETLEEMHINYTSVDPTTVENNPSIINQYSLVIIDCPGWFGNPSSYTTDRQGKISAIYSTLTPYVQSGGVVLFSDIALMDLNSAFPGYVNLLGPNPPGTWSSNIYNPPEPSGAFSSEFLTQYYNAGPTPNSINVPTYGSGYAVASIQSSHIQDVRVFLDSDQFGIPYRPAILGFYFKLGSGVVEGMSYDRDLGIVPLNISDFYGVNEPYGNIFLYRPGSLGDFSISALPYGVSVTQGHIANFTLTLNSIGSFSSSITLQVSGLPASTQPTFTPTTVSTSPGAPGTSRLAISTAVNARPGAYQLSITGTAAFPLISHTVNVSLTIQPIIPDFTLMAQPTSLSIHAGQCGNTTITLGSIGGFNSPVNVTASGLPSHVTGRFTRAAVTPPIRGSVSTILTVCVGSDVNVGGYAFTIVGQGRAPGGPIQIHQVTLALNVGGPVLPKVNPLIFLLLLLVSILGVALALLFIALSRRGREDARGGRPFIIGRLRVGVRTIRPRVQYVMPLPTIKCKYCLRIMPLHSVYCPFCGRPQVILKRPLGTVGGAISTGKRSFIFSLIAGLLVIVNSGLLLAPGFWGSPANWSGIFFWLPSVGPVYGFVLGLVIGIVLIMGSLVNIFRYGVLSDLIILPFSIFSLIVGGGFLLGMILGVIAGILAAKRRP